MRPTRQNYLKVASQILDFMKEVEMIPFHAVDPSTEVIADKLREQSYLKKECGICHIATSWQMGVETDEGIALFLWHNETLDEDTLKVTILHSLADVESMPGNCYLVVLADTVAGLFHMQMLGRRMVAPLRNEIKKQRKPQGENDLEVDVRLHTLHIPEKNVQDFSIAIDCRIHALQYPRGGQGNLQVASDTYMAKLYDIVEMYNKMGTCLFDRNVRYHIKDQIGVESSIRKTLCKEPNAFFHLNNGIALQVLDSTLFDTYNAESLRFRNIGADQVSIINGAQTITAAAEFFFQQDSHEKLGEKKPSEENSDIDPIERAKKEAWVLLRVFYPNGTSKVDQSEFDKISIALNRQKPIAAPDIIAYSCPEIEIINQCFQAHRDLFHFTISKRGQSTQHAANYQLPTFGRLVTAYYHDMPARARSAATESIIHYPEEEDMNSSKLFIYAPFCESEEEPEYLFQKWYRPVNFAGAVIEAYSPIEKEYRQAVRSGISGKDNSAIVVANGRYFFLAYIVKLLNSSTGCADAEKNFSSFPYTAKSLKKIKGQLKGLILDFARLVAEYAETRYLLDRPLLDSNDFKTDALYKKWSTYASESNIVQDWGLRFRKALDE